MSTYTSNVVKKLTFFIACAQVDKNEKFVFMLLSYLLTTGLPGFCKQIEELSQEQCKQSQIDEDHDEIQVM